jgi:hypothetical protein
MLLNYNFFPEPVGSIACIDLFNLMKITNYIINLIRYIFGFVPPNAAISEVPHQKQESRRHQPLESVPEPKRPPQILNWSRIRPSGSGPQPGNQPKRYTPPLAQPDRLITYSPHSYRKNYSGQHRKGLGHKVDGRYNKVFKNQLRSELARLNEKGEHTKAN